MIYSTLERAMKEGLIISVFADESNPDSFAVGKVIHLNEEFYVMRCLTINGDPDGYVVKFVEDTFRIDADIYTGTIARLYAKKGDPDTENIPDGDLETLLDWMRKRWMIVTVTAYGSGKFIYGMIGESDGETVVIRTINDIGVDDGICEMRLDSIGSILFLSSAEKALAMLREE